MNGVERVEHNGNLIAIVIYANFKQDSIVFFTPNDLSQQLAYMNRPKGYRIAPHIHNPVARKVVRTQETLFIRSGKVKVALFSDQGQHLQDVVLTQGDVILLVSGGHGFEMIEATEMIEVKQGPYAGDQDKSPLTV